MIAQHGVAALFTAPTAIRAIRKEDPEAALLGGRDLPSLRTLFLAGERTDPDTYAWAQPRARPARDRPLVADRDRLADRGELPRPRAAARQAGLAEPGRCPATTCDMLDADGERRPGRRAGRHRHAAAAAAGRAADALERRRALRRASYLARYPGYYLTGDGGHLDEDGYLFVMGRIDDVINVAGHRLSTGAMEEVVATHPDVAECAVIGVPDELRGEVPLGLVVLKAGAERDAAELRDELVALVRDRIGPVACFRDARVVARLPKTRSGKILRGTMRDIAAGRDVRAAGDDRRPGDPRRDRRRARRPGLRLRSRLGSGRAAPRVPALVALLVESSAGLGDVEVTQAYGYDAVAAGGRAFALVARRRRASAFACPTGISSPPRTSCRAAGRCTRTSSASATGCVLPGEVSEDREALREWLRHAHALTAGRV